MSLLLASKIKLFSFSKFIFYLRSLLGRGNKKKSNHFDVITHSKHWFWPFLTDLGRLIGKTQCCNFRILREINFCHFEAQKMPFWPFEQHWMLNFWELLTFLMWKFSRDQNSKSPKLFKNGSFWPSEISQNWFHVKSEWQENC